MAITFPKTLVDQFQHTNKKVSWGVDFYNQFDLSQFKEPADVKICDSIKKAKTMYDSKLLVLMHLNIKK